MKSVKKFESVKNLMASNFNSKVVVGGGGVKLVGVYVSGVTGITAPSTTVTGR